jgi:hypothetical protein
MKVLHLTLKKKWFDMIASGEKPEEYREPTNFILPRLIELEEPFQVPHASILYHSVREAFWFSLGYRGTRERALEFMFSTCAKWKSYDAITFINGYRRDSKRITLKFRGVEYTEGIKEWGAEPGKKYFVIKLGERL